MVKQPKKNPNNADSVITSNMSSMDCLLPRRRFSLKAAVAPSD